MNNIAIDLQGTTTIAIAGHIRPDGDCVGSCMGLYHYIKDRYPKILVDVYLEQPPKIFGYIKNIDEINSTYDKDMAYDLFISLDSGDKERLGMANKYFDTAKKTICIDHHISNPGYGDINYIFPDASSTSELVYDWLEKDFINKECAEALYTGMVHDTGVFQYTNTQPSTMRAAASLMEKGINFHSIIEDTFYKKTYLQNQILGRALLESITLLDGKVIASGLDHDTLEFYGVESSDLEGIVSQLRLTKGIEVAIFLYSTGHLEYKVSLRSNGVVDVSKVASILGGGGHMKAAGCTVVGTMKDVVNNIVCLIEKQLR
ncbi:MAG TPA: bifunctional oligoribonuclease/PAP phosphatase NrnA [Candidatus Merdenecus merdavium]|nr:bifunctional oligoribonuclease/PAP phosphatase NrnA [Candidatus Merdenecus merdavium]